MPDDECRGEPFARNLSIGVLLDWPPAGSTRMAVSQYVWIRNIRPREAGA